VAVRVLPKVWELTLAEMASTTALSVKLLIDRRTQRVVFAEVSKQVVDFLFSLLSLPIATAVKLVGKGAMAGSVGNLYASVEKLDRDYLQTGASKKALLCPTVISPAAGANNPLLRLPEPTSSSKTFYKCEYRYCSSSNRYVTDVSDTRCPSCSHRMTAPMRYVARAPASGSGSRQLVQGASAKGFVRGVVTYTVQDDLTVTPMSTISSITLLITFAVRGSIFDLQEKIVPLGYTEVNILSFSFPAVPQPQLSTLRPCLDQ
jgi:hypothetical protein